MAIIIPFPSDEDQDDADYRQAAGQVLAMAEAIRDGDTLRLAEALSGTELPRTHTLEAAAVLLSLEPNRLADVRYRLQSGKLPTALGIIFGTESL